MPDWKILIADDDPEDREIIGDAMQKLSQQDILGFAENGEAALDILNDCYSNGDIPCLIILDLNMPRMNGTQTLKAIKQDHRLKTIPVIIYSTSINPMEKEKCLQLGAHSYMVKPISVRESIETAKTFLEFCS
jgi:CheY-like chemotaxis protein